MQKPELWIARHWLLAFSLLWGTFITLPWLAPVFMHLGWEPAGLALYRAYSFVCHQLPERSFFLFGPKFTYSLAEVQAAYMPTTDPGLLRQFVGNAATGWKVAWSDRMFSMYSAMLPAAWVWALLRRKLRMLPVWGLVLFMLPMAIDGTSHLISDFWGIGQGFRDANIWLATLTNNAFPATFYAGDAWGSFNSIMRLLSGVLFSLGIMWFACPYIDESFSLALAPAYNKNKETTRRLD